MQNGTLFGLIDGDDRSKFLLILIKIFMMEVY